jgi:polyhydroxyalkanoate synthesis regulator phasin
MATYKLLKELKKNLKEVEESIPVNWLGKWAKQVRIKSISSRIKTLEKQISKLKNK